MEHKTYKWNGDSGKMELMWDYTVETIEIKKNRGGVIVDIQTNTRQLYNYAHLSVAGKDNANQHYHDMTIEVVSEQVTDYLNQVIDGVNNLDGTDWALHSWDYDHGVLIGYPKGDVKQDTVVLTRSKLEKDLTDKMRDWIQEHNQYENIVEFFESNMILFDEDGYRV